MSQLEEIEKYLCFYDVPEFWFELVVQESFV